MAPQRDWQCDGCLQEKSGFNKREITDEGWEWFSIKGTKVFTLCDECLVRFEPIWEARKTKLGAAA